MEKRTHALDLLTIVAILSLLLQFWAGSILIPRVLVHHDTDFSAYYDAGKRLRTSPPTLYDKSRGASFIHPAFEAFVFAPLSSLSYDRAYLMFMVINTALVAFLWIRFAFPWELMALAGLSMTVITGQDSILFFGLLCLSWNAAKRGETFWCGALMGLALFRFQIVLPLILVFVAWKEWKVLYGFVISAVAAFAASAVVFSPIKYAQMVGDLALNEYPQPVDRMTNLRALFHHLTPHHSVMLTIPVSIAVLGLAARFGTSERLDRKLEISILVAALISYHLFVHDLIVLVLPLTMILKLGGRLIAAGAVAVNTSAFFNSGFYFIPIATLLLLTFVLWKVSEHSHGKGGQASTESDVAFADNRSG